MKVICVIYLNEIKFKPIEEFYMYKISVMSKFLNNSYIQVMVFLVVILWRDVVEYQHFRPLKHW